MALAIKIDDKIAGPIFFDGIVGPIYFEKKNKIKFLLTSPHLLLTWDGV